MYKVVIADDFQIILDGLKIILSGSNLFTIIGEATNGDDLIDIVAEKNPDLVISDLKMPGVSIIESCHKLKEMNPNVRIIVLTAFDESEDIYNAVDVGIDGYIMKDTRPEQMLKVLETVMDGYSIFQPKVNLRKTQQNPQSLSDTFDLTEREYQVFKLIAENLSNQAIAEQLYISEATVKTHVGNILKKTGQSNRSQAVLHALKKGYFKQ